MPQLTWNDGSTRSPGARAAAPRASTGIAHLDDLGHGLVAEGELPGPRGPAEHEERVDLAARDGDRAHQCVGGVDEGRFGDLEPLDLAGCGARELLHAETWLRDRAAVNGPRCDMRRPIHAGAAGSSRQPAVMAAAPTSASTTPATWARARRSWVSVVASSTVEAG